MENEKNGAKNKGGRPTSKLKKDQSLTVKCNIIERKVIEKKASDNGSCTSEYLRMLGINGKVVRRKKRLPKEVSEYAGTLNRVAANLNQITKKLNYNEQFGNVEIELYDLGNALKQYIGNVKKHFE